MNDTIMKEKPIFPLLTSMALPMVVSMLVNALYNIVDSLFVARISEEAMTALSLVYPVQNLINAIAIGFSIGVAALISLHLGAGNKEKADMAATHGMVLSLIHGVVMSIVCAAIMAAGTVLCLAIPAQLMGLFTQNPESIRAGAEALRIISAGFLVSSVSVAAGGALEGLGKGGPSLVISLLRYTLVMIPAAWLLSRLIGPAGVWHAFWLSEAVTALLSILIYRRSVR